MKQFSRFVRDEPGATAIEDGMAAALISVLLISVVTLIGRSLITKFSTIASPRGREFLPGVSSLPDFREIRRQIFPPKSWA